MIKDERCRADNQIKEPHPTCVANRPLPAASLLCLTATGVPSFVMVCCRTGKHSVKGRFLMSASISTDRCAEELAAINGMLANEIAASA